MPGPTPNPNDDRKKRRKDEAGAERYPPVRQDDSVDPSGRLPAGTSGERRSFETPDPSTDEGRLGPRGDPAEGKR